MVLGRGHRKPSTPSAIASSPGGASSTTTSDFSIPEKGKGKAGSSPGVRLLNKWTPDKTTLYTELSPPLKCNRPTCSGDLQRFIPPGTNPVTGVTFAKCKNLDCAGGGSILAFDTKCFVCLRAIPAGSVCLSLSTGHKQYANLHLRNCLLDKIEGTEDSAVARKATAKDIGEPCTTCKRRDNADRLIKEDDILLATAPIGQRMLYTFARAKRREFKDLVYADQDERHASFRKKELHEGKKVKTDDRVSIHALPEDSEDDDDV